MNKNISAVICVLCGVAALLLVSKNIRVGYKHAIEEIFPDQVPTCLIVKKCVVTLQTSGAFIQLNDSPKSIRLSDAEYNSNTLPNDSRVLVVINATDEIQCSVIRGSADELCGNALLDLLK